MRAPTVVTLWYCMVILLLVLITASGGEAKPVNRAANHHVLHKTMMEQLFGARTVHAPLQPASDIVSDDLHSDDIILIGRAKVTVGPAPGYIQARDVYTRDFWLESIERLITRVFTVVDEGKIARKKQGGMLENADGVKDVDVGDISKQANGDDLNVKEEAAEDGIDGSVGKDIDISEDISQDSIETEIEMELREHKVEEQKDESIEATLNDQSDESEGGIDGGEIGQAGGKVGQAGGKVGQAGGKVGQVEENVDEIMREIRRKGWTDEELEELFWIIHDLIVSGGIEIEDGKITIDGEDFYLKDIISQCCPIG